GAAAATTAAAMTSATLNAWVTWAGPAAVDSPDSTGITARAARLAARAMALFTPDATLTWSGSAAAITVAVSGATNVTRPAPNTTAPGSTSVVHDGWMPARVRSNNPAAATSGPTVSWTCGPMRWANAPER